MPDLRDFLSRFRPAGAPGAARAGVGPVLALLGGTQAECERIKRGPGRTPGSWLSDGTSATIKRSRT